MLSDLLPLLKGFLLRFLLCLAILIGSLTTTPSIHAVETWDDGVEAHVESDGYRFTVRTRRSVDETTCVLAHLVYRRVDDQSDAKHDNEEAHGLGLAAGGRWYSHRGQKGFLRWA